MFCNLLQWFFTANLYKHNPKLDDWARNALKSDLDVSPEKRGDYYSMKYYVVIDGIYVWVANGWAGFSIQTVETIKYYGNFKHVLIDFDAPKYRPRFDLALRLWWKIKKARTEWNDI